MCGSIINWEIYAENVDDGKRRRRRGGKESSRSRGSRSTSRPADSAAPLLGLQVWRPVGLPPDSTGTGCYRLIGSQGVSSIIIPDDDQQFTLGPSLAYGIPFQPRDVLGFYVNISDSYEYNGVKIQSVPSGTSNMTVWYTENQIASTTDTVYLTGNSSDGDLHYYRHMAPAVSISIGKQSPRQIIHNTIIIFMFIKHRDLSMSLFSLDNEHRYNLHHS